MKPKSKPTPTKIKKVFKEFNLPPPTEYNIAYYSIRGEDELRKDCANAHKGNSSPSNNLKDKLHRAGFTENETLLILKLTINHILASPEMQLKPNIKGAPMTGMLNNYKRELGDMLEGMKL